MILISLNIGACWKRYAYCWVLCKEQKRRSPAFVLSGVGDFMYLPCLHF